MSGGGLATIDRYEHPNVRGQLPTLSPTPAAAAAACLAEGKHLCDSQEWYEACSDAGDTFYVVKSAPYDPIAIRRLLEVCNVRHPDRPPELEAAGARPRCYGRLRVHDLVGNAFEWVRLDGMPAGFWGLAGSYYRYSDAQTMSCGFRVLVHESQLELIEPGGVGFRCCR